MPPIPLNDDVRDRVIRHEIYLRRVGNQINLEVQKLLAQAELDVQREIEKRLAWIAERGYDASPYVLRRLESNLSEIRAVMIGGVRGATESLRGSLLELAHHEAEWAAGVVSGIASKVGVNLGIGLAEGSLMNAIVTKEPFQGGLLREWTANLSRTAAQAVQRSVRLGLLEGKSISDIVAAIRGTKKAGFKDGALSMTKRNAESVVRTAVSHVANSARESTWRENDDVIKGIQWVSTLDDRTTPQCQVRDGKLYDLDYEPIGHSVPWGAGPGALHWNCRSTSAPVLKSWKEMGIDARELTGEQRAAMDGMVPAEQTFEQWITGMKDKGNIAAVEEILGAKRTAAFMGGEIKFRDLFNAKGDFLTLAQLKIADPGAAATKALLSGGEPLKKLAAQMAEIAERPLPKTMEQFEQMLKDAGHQVEIDIQRGTYGGGPTKGGGFITPLENWNQAMKVRPDDYINGLTGGRPFKGRLEMFKYGFGRTTNLGGEIMGVDEAGRRVAIGSLERNVLGDSVDHAYFKLNKELQGGGIAKDILRSQFELYKKIGVDKVVLDANINVGGYAWAKYGFKPTKEGWVQLRSQLLAELDSWTQDSKMMRSMGIYEDDFDAIETLLRSNDPRSIWAIADMRTSTGVDIGKKLLLNSHWSGTMSLTDREAMARFNAYINRGA